MELYSFEKQIVAKQVTKFSVFIDLVGSFQSSEEPVTRLHLDPDESSPPIHTLFL
jgi:hypothetical protein